MTASSRDDAPVPFVGRRSALDALDEAWRAARDGLVIQHVLGVSGVGKSTVVQHFVDGLTGPAPVVLHGTCHAGLGRGHAMLEGIVDGLAEHLRDHPLLDWRGSPAFDAATRLFPSLAGGVAPEHPPAAHAADLRDAGVRAVCALIAQIARRAPSLVWLRDVHWADPDGLEVLRRLTVHDPPMLVISTCRADMVPNGLPAGRSLNLQPLSQAEASEMLEACVGERAASLDVGRLMRETGGLPIWVSQFCRYLNAQAPDPASVGSLSLAKLLDLRLESLSPGQRRLVEVVALCERPVEIAVALNAAGVGPAEIEGACSAGFLQREGQGGRRLGVLHHKVRRLADRLGQSQRREIHRRIALVWGEESDDPAALAHHWAEAGEPETAGDYAEQAGDRVRGRLALGEAARHYIRALELLTDGREQQRLYRKLAEVRVGLGRGREAGEAFARAAGLLEAGAIARQGSDASRDLALRRVHLQRRAAEQFFHAGQILDALRIIGGVLGRFGIRLPNGRRWSLLMSLFFRFSVALGGPWRRSGGDPARFEALWTASTSLSHVNHAIADAFVARCVLEARRLSDSSRLLRALGYEAVAQITLGWRFFDRGAAALMVEAQVLLDAGADDYDRAWFATCRAARATFLADWQGTVDFAAQAEAHYLRVGPGVHWERAVNAGYRMAALALLGDLGALQTLQAEIRETAAARNDPLALNSARSGHPAVIWLYRDDLETAEREAKGHLDGEVRRSGRWPDDIFRTPDYHNLVADVQRALYAGQGGDALTRVERDWPQVREALFLQVRYIRADLRYLRGRAALAAARQTANARAMTIARRMAAALARDPGPCSQAYAAAMAAALGAAPDVWLPKARGRFEALGMRVHQAAAALWSGEQRGEAPVVEGALSALRSLGIIDPRRTAALVMPPPAG